ncbi:site-specific integrase [Rhodococcus rhodochrous]|uniref:tyrosine-type recombinase/integrase n=1 Tax=Rhodococcus rhodochrous TaxID=1829 RepID=UPI000D074A60|nr:tyrosine-type recombinase/integrase [Rhodococcus rhodochrous]AYA26713.1 site-specific integrase [Rhodococcus rhodochrous]
MAAVVKYVTSKGEQRYEVRYRTPDHRTTRKRGFKTKRDAQLWADRLGVSLARGEFVATSAGRATVGELGARWLEHQRGHMRPSGWRSYESTWRTHVEPRWGRTPVARIRHTDLQGWVSELAAQRGPVTVRRAHSLLAQILDGAVRDGLVASNPARGARMPRKPSPRHIFLSHEQVAALADEAGRYRSLVLLLSYCGLRWGEVAALRPMDIDFLKRRVRLERNAVNVGREIVVGPLKGHQARTVPVPGLVLEALARACEGRGRDELLWPARDGGYLRPPSSHDSWLSGAVERCQRSDPSFPRITVHGLRHTAASLMVSAGANVKAVQAALGHETASMTLDTYAALFSGDLDAVADALDRAASNSRPRDEERPDSDTGTGL